MQNVDGFFLTVLSSLTVLEIYTELVLLVILTPFCLFQAS